MKKEELSFIAAFEKIVPITTFIQLTTVSRAGYYKWKKEKEKRLRDDQYQDVLIIHKVNKASRGTYGKKRIKAALLRQHGLISIIRVCRIRQKRFKRNIQPHGTKKNELSLRFAVHPITVGSVTVMVRLYVFKFTFMPIGTAAL
jgi:putative transposase